MLMNAGVEYTQEGQAPEDTSSKTTKNRIGVVLRSFNICISYEAT